MRCLGLILLVFLMVFSVLAAQEGEVKHPVRAASGQGVYITLEEVEQALAGQLQNLELERLRFDAEQRRKRHELVREKTEELVGQRLIEIESNFRRMKPEQLFQMIESEAPEPTDEEVEKVWESNKDRIKEPREQVEPQIRQYLKRQKSQKLFTEFLESLVEKFGVSYHLEPLRFEVAADGFPAKGPADAPVTIVEFSDFECPYCARVGPTMNQVMERYGDRVRLVFRHYPLVSIHKLAQDAAEASLCAADQDKFWEMHDALFANQQGLAPEKLKETAQTLGLEMEAFSECLDSNRKAPLVLADVRDALKAGVSGTPAFFINGRPLTGAVAFEKLAEVIDEELAAAEKN